MESSEKVLEILSESYYQKIVSHSFIWILKRKETS